ncbi:peptidylprolyl isomerase [Hydrogenophaga sp. PAMC20947]|uniref:peptidylprolyl isomerase n=1 Tax=Hydrogenophaga sp. PAMC20947 TaxID=2565558 RepID=UPI00109DB4BF|nr:peptidylprolyl isomerase [Hydrogenophaga sp. PAMC20947]QCB45048.1 peptidyl-prolyl cis-trans isomerase [Hydrogenophaga sp. PAMC20947]
MFRHDFLASATLKPVAPASARRRLNRLIAGATLALAIPAVGWAQDASPRVRLTTSMGDIVIALDATKAPLSAENFLQYVKDKHYEGTVFHRVIDNFMIQGGGFTTQMKQKATRAPVALEASNGLKNDRGTVAMARTSNPNSATSQFFINLVDNAPLNAPSPDGYGYTVFGKVIAGMDVVDKIKSVPVGNQGMFQNVPTTPITILKATLEK